MMTIARCPDAGCAEADGPATEWLSTLANHCLLMHLVKTLRKWGNIYALPLSLKEAKAMGLHPGDEVEIDVKRHARAIDLSDLPTLPLGSTNVDLDLVAERAASEDLGGR